MPTFRAADAAELHYDEWGEGRTLVVLPGGAGRHPEYLGDLAGLPGRLVVHHFRGSGKSASAATVSFWEQARDLEDLRAHLGLARLDLVAHSAGTRVAVAYAAQYPDRVASMLLITPPVAPIEGRRHRNRRNAYSRTTRTRGADHDETRRDSA